MILDLTKSGTLNDEQIVLFNEVAKLARKKFSGLIGELSEGREDDIDWWVSEIASRNTFSSNIFEEFCFILFVKEYIKIEKNICEILVDSTPLFFSLRNYLTRHGIIVSLTLRINYISSFFDLFKVFTRYVKFLFTFFLRFFYGRFKFPKKFETLPDKLTLIDTFLFSHSFKEGTFQDRYYQKFCSFIFDSEKRNFFYFPTFQVKIMELYSLFSSIRNSSDNFLLIEDVLSVEDYFWAFLFPFRALRFFPRKVEYDGFDFTRIFQSVWFFNLTSFSSIEALLKYRFVEKLKNRKVGLRLVVDWFENQNIDKGFNAGVRKFFPQTPIIGYQGFITTNFYLCIFPTPMEFKSKILPTSIAVCGRSLVDSCKEFCPTLEVFVAPALRYSEVWKSRSIYPDPDFFTVLITLDVTLEANRDILFAVLFSTKEGLPENVRFRVKPHPGGPQIERLLQLLQISLPESFEIITGAFNDHLEESDLLLSNSSSTCLEAVARGIPTIIIGSKNSFSRNPIPEGVHTDLWRLCYNQKDTAGWITHFSRTNYEEKKNLERLGEEVKRNYFEPVNRDSVRAFLRL